MIKSLENLIELAKNKNKKILSVAVAQDKEVLKAVLSGVSIGIINAILVGDKEKIEQICKEENWDLKGLEIVNVKNDKKAAEEAVKLVSTNKADFIMKGMLSTADLLKAVLNKEFGLRGKSLLSHVMLYETQNYHKLLFLTDGGMVPYPELKDKIGIIDNAVKVANAVGIDMPKVAPLCAVEVVNQSMTATIDASILSSMNKRGQIKDCVIDGPLALDNAISLEAAKHKGIVSEVAGDADILLVPNIEAGNLLGKSLTYFGNAESAGIVMGAKCPIVLVSRADTAKSKLYSIALGAIVE
ncbi:phosphate butyryltransferase [Clostridium frigidicarnis]|uniref:Phosphate butyryltransferase n=1 Tax=Clostridium frigidicarnis TaxID=84698 RepID=A0A1I0WKY5_9CLOT|nr:phosphate butyryltransferase [Clostridium frigidicarnis]SFA88810.1 phosphate butyryltransferase [Clostridium frigidicarnis]